MCTKWFAFSGGGEVILLQWHKNNSVDDAYLIWTRCKLSPSPCSTKSPKLWPSPSCRHIIVTSDFLLSCWMYRQTRSHMSQKCQVVISNCVITVQYISGVRAHAMLGKKRSFSLLGFESSSQVPLSVHRWILILELQLSEIASDKK